MSYGTEGDVIPKKRKATRKRKAGKSKRKGKK